MSGPVVTAAGLDWAAVGTAVGTVGAVAAGIWAAWQARLKAAAQTRAEVAESNASTAVADAQKTVYSTLTERLTTLENDVRTLRQELAEERSHSRRLVEHIWMLEGLMRAANMTPPPFNPGRAT